MDQLPLSLLNDFIYCTRRAALKLIEGWRGENAFTLEGTMTHKQVDFPGFEEREDWTLLRALPVWSERLGLSGKADLVEVRFGQACFPYRDLGKGDSLTPPLQLNSLRGKSDGITTLRPVEYKRGRKSRWANDHVQLCAQALCLEEMFGLGVPEGHVFHALSHQRTIVVFDDALRRFTEHSVTALRMLFEASRVPPAILKPQCDGCSLREICLPELPGASSNLDSLFAT
jgi:CRISPR-associated exonuclease Cas4